MSVLKTENLTYMYSEGTPFQIVAIKDVNLSVEAGELVAVIGHTGSGKSTLIQHFNGLLKPSSGKVYVDGQDIWESKATLRQSRFTVGLCFQYPEYQLFEETAYKDIAFGPKNMKLDEAEIDRRVRQAASYVGVTDDMLEKSPFDLSGGEKRRVAIAGVMAMEPKVLILDEPTAGLDPRGRDQILELIRSYREQTGSTVLLVSHSMEDVAKIATKVMVINNKNVEMFGTVEEIFEHAGRLIEIGLDVPQITKVFLGLKERGLPVRTDIYTVQQGREELNRLREMKQRGGDAAW
ncbi:MAG: energy-coupling factor transporter ATPase [Clostridia bacterium]|nr:energy-coupling factor transporter ATPase [Clostridia bacterium]